MYMQRDNMKITEKTFDVETGKETLTERDETPQEIAERELAEKNHAIFKAENEARAIAKAALLKRLNMTAEEAALLLA